MSLCMIIYYACLISPYICENLRVYILTEASTILLDKEMGAATRAIDDLVGPKTGHSGSNFKSNIKFNSANLPMWQ